MEGYCLPPSVLFHTTIGKYKYYFMYFIQYYTTLKKIGKMLLVVKNRTLKIHCQYFNTFIQVYTTL